MNQNLRCGEQFANLRHPDGAVADRLTLGGLRPTNVVFGPAGSHKLYVTEVEQGVLEVLDVPTDGLPLNR